MDTSFGMRVLKRRTLALCIAALCGATLADNTIARERFSMAPLPPRLAALAPPALGPFTPSSTIAVTNCEDSGTGSLRDAVNNAASGDVVDMTGLACSEITLTTGAIVFAQSQIGFIGPGREKLAIDASGSPNADVLYDLAGVGSELYINGLTIENGTKYRSDHDARGGCIYSNGNVLIVHSAVQNCEASTIAPYHVQGGGVFSYGETYLLDTRIVGNRAYNPSDYASGGGVYAIGGFQSNYAQIADNAAEGYNSWGGGVLARGSVLILNTEISDNLAVNEAGASLADNNGMPATMINSTVSGNIAGSKVGGVYARPKLYMYNCTVAFNQELIWKNGAGSYYGAGVNVNVVSTIYSSILSNNTVPNVGTPGDDFDLSGNALGVSGADDIIMEFNIGIPVSTDHGDPGLQALRENGGPTRTMRPTSPIAFYGDNHLNLNYDQRGVGFPRVTAAGDTIGAYALNPDVIFIDGFD